MKQTKLGINLIEALVVKNGVMLGCLPEPERETALALVWAALPARSHRDEATINVDLKAQLDAAARCLDTDHVELRRWLVDTGFLQRDGYGRNYVQTALHDLPPGPRAAADEVLAAAADRTVPDWVDALRSAMAERRAARRSAWLAERGSSAGGLG